MEKQQNVNGRKETVEAGEEKIIKVKKKELSVGRKGKRYRRERKA